jgi:hypothetical protein
LPVVAMSQVTIKGAKPPKTPTLRLYEIEMPVARTATRKKVRHGGGPAAAIEAEEETQGGLQKRHALHAWLRCKPAEGGQDHAQQQRHRNQQHRPMPEPVGKNSA